MARPDRRVLIDRPAFRSPEDRVSLGRWARSTPCSGSPPLEGSVRGRASCWRSSSAPGPSSTTRASSGEGSSRRLLGTFMLVLVAAGGGLLHGKGQISLAAAVVAPGLMVMAIILFMGAVSGAHLNPVVSLAFALRGDFPWKRLPGYVVGPARWARRLACLFVYAVFGNVHHLGATLPGPGYANWQALLMEVALTGDIGERDPRDRVRCSERRRDRRAGRRRVHRTCGPLVGARERRLDEPCPLLRSSPRERGLQQLLGLRRRSARRRTASRRQRISPTRAGWRPDLAPRWVRRAGCRGRTQRDTARPASGRPPRKPADAAQASLRGTFAVGVDAVHERHTVIAVGDVGADLAH